MADDRERFLGPTTIRFCPLCGGSLRRASVPPDHREQAVCRLCEFVFYLNPKVVAGTIPEQDGRVLLTRRSINPGHGLWTFPGGFVDFGESVTDAAVRETLEETGHRIAPTALVGVYRWQAPDTGATFIRFAFAGEVVAHDAARALDAGILRVLWLGYDELAARRATHRSPLVMRCVDDYRAGLRRPLEHITEM